MTVKGRIRHNRMYMKHLKQTDNKNDKVSCFSMNQFIQELKRRKVFKVAAVYAVVSWMLIQVATAITPALQLPTWTPSLVVVLLMLGFIPTLIASGAIQHVHTTAHAAWW